MGTFVMVTGEIAALASIGYAGLTVATQGWRHRMTGLQATLGLLAVKGGAALFVFGYLMK